MGGFCCQVACVLFESDCVFRESNAVQLLRKVLFYQPDAEPERNFVGETDAEGRFVLTTLRKERAGASPGKYVVTLTTAFAGPETLETDPLPREKIPPKFRTLQFEVPPAGTTAADFELTSK